MDCPMNPQLEGEANFLSWYRNFRRVAIAHGLLDIYQGTEKILQNPPKEEDCLVWIDVGQQNSSTPSKTLDSARTFFKYQIEIEKYKENQKKARQAYALIMKSISSSIALEVDEYDNAFAIMTKLREHYRPADHKIKQVILDKIVQLKLADYENMSEYLYEHLLLRADLRQTNYIYQEHRMIACILRGLSDHYQPFKTRYHWLSIESPNTSVDLKLVIKMLYDEEEKLNEARVNGTEK